MQARGILPEICYGSSHKPAPSPPLVVYGLVDPRTDLVCYVGCTTQGVDSRIKGHKSNQTVAVKAWREDLKTLGLEWTVVILEEVAAGDDWVAALYGAERRWMGNLRRAGAPLLNSRWTP